MHRSRRRAGRTDRDPDRQFGKIAEHGRRADGIVTSMLLHSRGGTGERQTTDLNALAEEALNLAFHGARAQDRSFNIALERDFDGRIGSNRNGPAGHHPRASESVRQWLLRCRQTPAGRDATRIPASLRVATRDLGDQVEIRVRDNGVGMPPEVQTSCSRRSSRPSRPARAPAWDCRSATTSSPSSTAAR